MTKRLLVSVVLLLGILSCASRPPGFPFWLIQEGQTRTFGRDRDFIRFNCGLLKRDDPSQPFRTVKEIRAYAQTLGATTVVIEKTESTQRERMSFYECHTFPPQDSR